MEIRNVWEDNLDEEMAMIREVVQKFPYVSMDTEFPGVVARPISDTYTTDFHYQSLKCNVDLLRIIQLGLSFADEKGNFCAERSKASQTSSSNSSALEGEAECSCWQFNFKFSLGDDLYAQDSIDLLITSGISFEDHKKRGIDPVRFGELCMVSGLVLCPPVKWVSFHSGYDYGYLLKLLTSQDLPETEREFFDILTLYFPTIFDIKFMCSLTDGFYGGLQKCADDLGAKRIGPEHQAGSDALLTMSTYFALAEKRFKNANGETDESRYRNELFGYGKNHTVRRGGKRGSVEDSEK